MNATVYFVSLTDEQRDQLNLQGWDSEIGKRYSAARFCESLDWGLMEEAAKAENFENAEQVWMSMQNLDEPWAAHPDLYCVTEFPRSMDVGDVVVWEDGTMERCASCGFETLEGNFYENRS